MPEAESHSMWLRGRQPGQKADCEKEVKTKVPRGREEEQAKVLRQTK